MALQVPRGVDDLDVDNRRVFVRVDFNVPLTPAGEVRDDTRIRAALPTLQNLRERGARLVVASHLGRPRGKVVPALSMEPVAARLAQLLDTEVRLPDEVVGDGVTKLVADTRPGQLVLLENLRFHPGETRNDPDLATALAGLCDAYVNDAFGACHRAHASVVGLPARVADRAAGLLLARELEALADLVDAPQHPFVAVVGGAKVSDKLGVLLALTERLKAGDAILVGGAMANTFLAAAGRSMGSSLMEKDRFADCKRVVDKAAARDVSLLLPTDLLVAEKLDATSARPVTLETDSLASTDRALDIGPRTVELFSGRVAAAAMVFWNGPMGLFENATFAEGTRGLARAVAACPGQTVVGGGDSLAAIADAGLGDQIGHLSTGGGASLELVEGRELPGVVALQQEAN
jgi:phosphoglycerate kinase